MSARGVQIAAEVFAAMQNARITLLSGGDTQDILLSQLFLKGNDAMKDDFCRILDMKGWPVKDQPKRALKGLSA